MKFIFIIRYIVFSIILFVLTSCEKKTEYSDDFFIGNQTQSALGYGHFDYAYPLPELLEFKNDSLFVTNLKKVKSIAIKAPFKEIMNGGTLPFYVAELDTVLDLTFQLRKNQGILKLSLKNKSNHTELQFHKPIKTPHWTKEEVVKTLTQGAFSSAIHKTSSPNSDFEIKKSLRFTTDSVTTTLSYYFSKELIHQETHTKRYILTEVGNMFFLTEDGDPHNPHILYQISAMDKNSFGLYYYDDQKEIFETYTFDENTVLKNITSFSKCREMRPLEYYHGDFTYLKGNDYIIEKISKNAPQATGNGYITVHFIINCKNQIGQLGLEQMDRSYQPADFDASLVKHIVDEILTLQAWPENKHSNDIHAFLMFKIENGKITDLCP